VTLTADLLTQTYSCADITDDRFPNSLIRYVCHFSVGCLEYFSVVNRVNPLDSLYNLGHCMMLQQIEFHSTNGHAKPDCNLHALLKYQQNLQPGVGRGGATFYVHPVE